MVSCKLFLFSKYFFKKSKFYFILKRSIYKKWCMCFLVYQLFSGLVFFMISVLLSIKKFHIKLKRNMNIRIFTICTNFFSILNCFLLLLKTISFICVLMYPTFLSYYYKHFECDVKPEVEEWNENCIKTISN